MVYVMSDIHGADEKFFKMLKKIKFENNDTLFILGDIVDRGYGAFKIFQFIMCKKNIKCLLGNHEDMMIKGLSGDSGYLQCWLYNGGRITYKQFLDLESKKQKAICDYIEKFKLYEEIEVSGKNFILVHSGLCVPDSESDKEKIFAMQSEEDFLWSREDFFKHKGIDNSMIIFGHTPVVHITETKEFKIWYDRKYNDKIGIDCGAIFPEQGGKLACIRLDDMKEFYV